ncbi:ABC transporter substrate-binding protein [Parasporobacterium paucivorans]|uniref:Raffinose/stachyose/melibiose transport system substrate-binding protein n=1 Tax=Parasporobacterium paucivorans DSM 15970 TaxID=1122934 RepID=A0A1M6LGR5_9FIRM|nr:extracellular solute-binding protein [Parasporobacterium paucivorans]SHJ70402.1 raffinose/stachyose/melibiose transport system substrate-binding protein [Parasporobacterium paucivorans DSM 15970]
MKYFRHIVCFLLVIPILSMALSGCASNGNVPEGTETAENLPPLEVWIFFDENTPGTHYLDSWESIAEEYGCKINVKTFSTEELKNKLRISLASNELPDIFAVWGGTFPNYLIDAGACLPVQNYIKDSGVDFKESYLVPYSDGNNYIFPCLPEAYAVTYCNNALMDEIGVKAPQTWEELMQLVEATNNYNLMHGTDYSAIELGDKDNWLGDLLYTMIVNRIDPFALEKLMSGELDFSDDIFLDAAYKVSDLIKAGAFPEDYLETGEVESIENFINGESVLFPHQSTITFYLMDNMGSEAISLVQFPDCDDFFNADYSHYLVDINHTLTPGLCINKNSKYTDKAADICMEFTKRVNKINVTQYGYINTTNDKTLTPPTDLASPAVELSDMLNEAEHLTGFWYSLLPQDDASAWRSLTKKLFAGAISPEQFIEEGGQYLNFK